MAMVRNLNGTSDNYPPKEYTTWKDWWEDKKGRKFGECSCCYCQGSASVGAHVQKTYSSNMKWYIVPLCNCCNNKSSIEVFEVRDSDLAAVE